jgi:hypothetical protein
MSTGTPAAQLRIAVFDDNGEVRDAFAVCFDVEDIAGVIERLNPNVVLVGAGRGGANTPAMRTLLALRREGDYLIALHVVHTEDEARNMALAAGCELYIPKGMRTSALIDLLVEAHASRTPSASVP